MRVLIVEDDALVAVNLCSIVQHENHQVAGLAIDKDSAIALLDAAAVDLVLLDMRLSDGLTGREVAAVAVERAVPFVMVSGHLRLLFEGAAGSAGVISKPYDDATIEATLQFFDRALAGLPLSALPRGLVLSLEWIERLGLKGWSAGERSRAEGVRHGGSLLPGPAPRTEPAHLAAGL